MYRLHWMKAFSAGAIATLAMTITLLAAPLINLPAINFGRLLGHFIGLSDVPGWAVHFVMGTLFATSYAGFFMPLMPARNHPWLNGTIFGILLFLLFELVALPILGGGVFANGDIGLVATAALSHAIFGFCTGVVYKPALQPLTA